MAKYNKKYVYIEIVSNNLNLMKEKKRKRLKLVGLSDYENSRPSELSGGMKQRASLCRLLFIDLKFNLDEPFGLLMLSLGRLVVNT